LILNDWLEFVKHSDPMAMLGWCFVLTDRHPF
jgi:hypothetical protein